MLTRCIILCTMILNSSRQLANDFKFICSLVIWFGSKKRTFFKTNKWLVDVVFLRLILFQTIYFSDAKKYTRKFVNFCEYSIIICY